MPKRPPIRQVYFVEAIGLGLVKIGVATRAAHRVRNLQIGSPARLALRGVIYSDDPHRLERGYHRTWAHVRQHGEWFALNQDLTVFIEEALWQPDLATAPAAILFHTPAKPPKRGTVTHQPSAWCWTVDEMMAGFTREWARTPYAPPMA